MKYCWVAMRHARSVQLSRVKVITPSTLVPALRRSWAVALSTTPAIRNANAEAVIGSAARHDHVARVGGDGTAGDASVRERVPGVGRHRRVALRQRLPSLRPLFDVGDPFARLRILAQGELVAIVDHDGRAAQVPRQGLIV